MKNLGELLAEIDKAGLFFGVKVDSVHSERLSGETALHIFAKWGDVEAIKTLINNGADINKLGEDGNTPLHYASMLGQIEAVKILLELGALNLKDMYGNTPKQLASHPEVTNYFSDHGF